MKIKTEKIQKMLEKVMKGVINNKIIPITSMLGLKLEDGILAITATDRFNYIRVLGDEVSGKDFQVTVPAEQFNRLIQRISAEDISLESTDSYVEVKAGTGKYKIELPLAEGSLIDFPDIPELEAKETGKITKEQIRSLLEQNKTCLAKTNEMPWFQGYHVSNTVMTGDGNVAAINEMKLLKKPYLFCREVIELLDTVNDEEITYLRNNDAILFETTDVIIYTLEMEDEERFPNKEIEECFEMGEDMSYAQLPKDEFLKALDRVSLFMSEADETSISLIFGKVDVSIKSKQNTGSEQIKYLESKNVKPFECFINIELLKNIVNVQKKAAFNLYFGDDSSLKFLGDGIKHLVALNNSGSTGVEGIKEDPMDGIELDDDDSSPL